MTQPPQYKIDARRRLYALEQIEEAYLVETGWTHMSSGEYAGMYQVPGGRIMVVGEEAPRCLAYYARDQALAEQKRRDRLLRSE